MRAKVHKCATTVDGNQIREADENAMVSSYLICDVCGQFGPPASFLSQDGLRLCYQCWFYEQQNQRNISSTTLNTATDSTSEPLDGEDASSTQDSFNPYP